MLTRREYLFIYDVSWANPNGDPDDENRPRIDEETGINIVRDARIKRTIRDQILAMNLDKSKYDVLIRKEFKEDGTLKTKEDIAGTRTLQEIADSFIDVRLFGLTYAVKNNNQAVTGPVQFKYGQSMHQVDVKEIKGTAVMPHKKSNNNSEDNENKDKDKDKDKGKKQGTFTNTPLLPYSLIKVYGIMSERNAQHTKLTSEDLDIMTEAMWFGHKAGDDVITGSKFGHEPRILIEIIYREGVLSHIGELDKLVSIRSEIPDKQIRDIGQVIIDFTEFKKMVDKNKDKIQEVRYAINSRVKMEPDIQSVFQDITCVPFRWVDKI